MPASFSQGFWQRVHGWLGNQSCHGSDDAQLLERFVAAKDEAAFQTLLEKHGPMVWGVCHRVLRHAQDAEDAFQATFLVLLRQADTIRKQGSVSSWLYGVALRTAQKARVETSRRHAKEKLTTVDAPARVTEAAMADGPIVEEELARLPDKYRLPLVLCYYQGQSLEHAAQSLGWPLGTVAGRMSRARDKLRLQLERRGVTLTATAVAATLAERATSALPPDLSQQTLHTCLAWLSPEKSVPASVLSLSQGVIQAMFWSKMKLASLVVIGLCLMAVSGRLLWSQDGAGDTGGKTGQTPTKDKNQITVIGKEVIDAKLKSLLKENESAYQVKIIQPMGVTLVLGGRVDVLVDIRDPNTNTGERKSAVIFENIEILAIRYEKGDMFVVLRLQYDQMLRLSYYENSTDGKVTLIQRAQDKAAPDKPEQAGKRSPKWKELAKLKLQLVLQEMQLREQEFNFGAGKLTLANVLDNSERVLRAELDVHEQKEKRMAAFRDHVRRLESFEARCKGQNESGALTMQDYLQAQYAVVEAKMKLAAEQGE
jgi:RNA polymerase sigma factor (sigma-70 family)